MEHQYENKDLKKLAVNKTVVFSSPIEGNDVLVRTGTISENAFFLHAFLNGYSKDYISMNKNDRIQFARRLKASLLGRVDIESWEELGEGNVSKLAFIDNVRLTLERFNDFLHNPTRIKGKSTRRLIKKVIEKEQDIETYSIIFLFLPLQSIINKILPEYQNCKEKLKNAANIIIKNCINYLISNKSFVKVEKNKQEFIVNNINFLLRVICKDAHKSAYRNYVKNLKDMEDEIDSVLIKTLSDNFNRDIYIIDGNTHLPFNMFPEEELYKHRKSIILLKIDDRKYEIVGRLLPGNRIQREFDYKDNLISKFNLFITNHDEFKLQYPELCNNNIENDNVTHDKEDDRNSCSSDSDEYYDQSSISSKYSSEEDKSSDED
tara:strand:- start:11351 stop:12481 length:1131 start_codon:yes stop_codon:yes gene_type:complete